MFRNNKIFSLHAYRRWLLISFLQFADFCLLWHLLNLLMLDAASYQFLITQTAILIVIFLPVLRIFRYNFYFSRSLFQMSFILLLEPENEEQAISKLFPMGRMVWGPCKDCVMKNSRKSNFGPRNN